MKSRIEILKYKKAYRQKHKVEISAYQRQWHLDHPCYGRKAYRRLLRRHPDYYADYRKKHHDDIVAYTKKWKKSQKIIWPVQQYYFCEYDD